MKIKEVEFVGAVAGKGGDAPSPLPQVAFAGRSNVGKSSLINRLLGRTRRQVARVSSTPGKTREINFYRVRAGGGRGDLEFLLVDLPGYGYARVPVEVRRSWAPLIEGYLSRSDRLAGVVQLIDARHAPTTEDVRMVEFLAKLGVPALFVLTKIDKLGRTERARSLSRAETALGVDADQIVPFSSKTGEGRDEILVTLESLLNGPGGEG